jgi:hypothetical protein
MDLLFFILFINVLALNTSCLSDNHRINLWIRMHKHLIFMVRFVLVFVDLMEIILFGSLFLCILPQLIILSFNIINFERGLYLWWTFYGILVIRIWTFKEHKDRYFMRNLQWNITKLKQLVINHIFKLRINML